MEIRDISERLVYYSETEELVNRLTHGLGALLSFLGVAALISAASHQGDNYRVVSAWIYGGAMATFYCLSTAYHSVRKPYVRYVFRILDHASIYLMIAGSYTPFSLVSLRGAWGWSIFGAVWGLGTLGAVLKIFTAHRLRIIGPLLYIGLGWIVVIALKPLSAALAAGGMLLLFAGGIAYTVGVVFYLWDRLPFNHAIWHLFVLTGSACHFLAIFYYVIPLPRT
ncbi:MAG TPA: hemolysin III [Geobacter sp.]|nr:hemolysin III [Geobacter sp.]